jgi:hypothetical protein
MSRAGATTTANIPATARPTAAVAVDIPPLEVALLLGGEVDAVIDRDFCLFVNKDRTD